MEIKDISQKFTLLKNSLIFRIIIGIFIILFGCFCMYFLSNFNKIPSKNILEEKHLLVKALQITPKNYPVNLFGYGVARPIRLVSLSSEVKGKVVFLNPKLRSGYFIPHGEVLLKIDDLDYNVAFCEAKSKVEQCKNLIEKLKKEQSIDSVRVKNFDRNKIITHFEFEYKKKLFDEYNIGTKIDVYNAEKSYNLACDSLDQISKKILLYPLKINEAKIKLRSLEANLIRAKVNLEKCEIRAQFNSRVKFSSVEIGEILSVGQEIAILADDSTLEIDVSLNINDVKNWLQFDSNDKNINNNWFRKLQSVPCKIICNESNYQWIGYLDRVLEFDKKSSTIKVVIKINSSDICKNKEQLPLVDGMFCTVNIPGCIMKNVFCLPNNAVSFENKVCIFDQNNRLKIVPVKVVRKEGNFVFISDGLKCSDIIIKNRLIDPVEGILLKVDGAISREDVDQ